ncbi:MAG: apolipoprotein N-acyltransferase [Nitrospirota bacterium]|nr:apolipoprotein N-acyltransferase [Nitrospirota bacterium]
MNHPKRLLLAVSSGFFLIFAFPPYDFSLIAWLALVPLIVAIDGIPRRRAFLFGFAGGIVHFVGTVYWVINSIHNYGHVPMVLSGLAMLLLAAYLACYWGGFAFLLNSVSADTISSKAALAPFLWVGLELLRGRFLTGFPWDLLGYTQYRQTTVIQVADITGVYGVSFLIVLVNVAIAFLLVGRLHGKKDIFLHRLSPSITFAGISLLTVMAVLAYGSWRIRAIDAAPVQKTIHVAVAQGNVEQDTKWDEDFRQSTLDIYRGLTEQGVAKKADLVIWPETAAPFLFNHELYWRNQVIDIAKDNKVAILFGSPEVQYPEPDKPLMHNSVFLLDPEGNDAGVYRKRHLVPFGEYVPLHSILFFLDKLVVGIGDFGGGKEATVLQYNGVPLSTAVCYEIIFPEEVREFAKGGAKLLTTVTNDAWFGNSSAPYQHFAMAAFRAVENRTPLARAANTGVSGFADSVGRIGPVSGIFTPALLDKTLEIKDNASFYTAYGDVFAWISAIVALVAVIGANINPRGGRKDAHP